MRTMIEFELKFQIPPARRAAVHAFVGGRKRPAFQPVHLQAIYFDTAQRLLARSGIALRLRHEGTAWVQTLKGAAPDGLGREEYNLTLEGVGDSDHPPDIDPQRHRGVPLGKRLIKLLAANSETETDADSGLRCNYRSDVRRLQRHLKTPFGTVELAFDEGHLASEGGRLPICELEIELISGQPMAVIDAARRWAPRFGLWLDTRSKAERGDLLARGLTVAAPRSDIAAIKLLEQHPPRAALQAALVSVRNPILANASQIASGNFDEEHVHQLRVMLRRLRVYFRLLDDDPAAAALGRPLAAAAAALFRDLGVARDQSVLAGPLSASIESALRQAGDDASLPLPGSSDTEADVVARIRSTTAQELLLELIEATLPTLVEALRTGDGGGMIADAVRPKAGSAKPADLRRLLAHRLRRWQRCVARDADRFGELDEAARHRLRKHVKRLRYAVEIARGLFGKRNAASISKPLKRAQRVLGDLNDLSNAIQAFGDSGGDHRVWFARGWLISRREALFARSVKPMQRLARATRKNRLR